MSRSANGRGVSRWREEVAAMLGRPTVIALDGAFDRPARDALRDWLAERPAGDRCGVVLDLRGAGRLDAPQRRLLLSTLVWPYTVAPVVVMVREPKELRGAIRADERLRHVEAVDSYVDASIALRAWRGGEPEGERVDAGARHRQVIERSLLAAERAAVAGDLDDALGWLELARALDGGLPATWELRRRQWAGEIGPAAAPASRPPQPIA
ncbi:hypothetical protein [Conexibacter arvalis]|uniref:Uncharacterized protein n=1 Tax=Conexibacter arvalis TaxID=912552 RepID=A0A840IJV9_9ACTN|nr:hypothetical protein [Conexibacter arvalis]MBB4664218.1 hypothetical protein [Conexibacter arvalis]